MAQGEESPRAWAILDEMRGRILALDPATESQRLLYDHELQRIHELSDARQERLLQADSGLPAILWAVLLIGAVSSWPLPTCSVLSTLVHTLMGAALALTIALVLFTVGALDYPFKGDIRVRPDAFLSVLERFERSTLSDL